MRVSVRIACGALCMASAGLLAQGCGSSKKVHSARGGTSAATSGGVTSGSLPGGTSAAARAPELSITAPARGSWVPGLSVAVEGQAIDRGGGLGAITVAGLPATVEADGRFQAQVPLQAGLNTIVVEARDRAGGRTERHVSVIAGATAPEDQLVSQAAGVRITDLALDGLEPMIGTAIEGQRAAISQQVLATRVPDVTLTGFNYGPATGAIDCVPGGLKVQVQVANVVLGISATVKILFFSQTYRGNITAQRLVLEAGADVGVQDGRPSVRLSQVVARAEGFAVPDFASDRRVEIQQQFQQAFAQAATANLASALQQALAAAVLSGTTRQSVLGRDLEARWALQSLAFDPDGLTATVGANVGALERPYGAEAPGSVAAGNPLPAMTGAGGQNNVALALHQDAMNRTLHAAWRAGALSNDLDQSKLDQLFGGLAETITTSTLMQAVPQLQGKFLPGLPLVLTVEGKLPPVVSVPDRGQAQLELAFGEMNFRLQLLDPKSGPVTVLQAVCAARVPAQLVEQAGEFRIQPVGEPALHVDVIGEDMPGTEKLLEQLAAQATGPAFASSLTRIQGLMLPAVSGFRLTGLTFQALDRCLVVQGRVGPGS